MPDAMRRTSFREVLALAKANALPEATFDPADTSHCGCALASGCWGSCGWHFARWDQQALYRREQQRFAEARQGWTTGELRRAWAEWLMAEEDAGNFSETGMHITWKPYAGLPYAFEPCPAYRAKVRAELADGQAEKQVERRKRYDGPPPNGWSPRRVEQ